MNAMLLRIGIDTGCGGLAPILADGSFEFIPIPERYDSSESRTYGTIKGRSGRYFSEFLPGDYFNKTCITIQNLILALMEIQRQKGRDS